MPSIHKFVYKLGKRRPKLEPKHRLMLGKYLGAGLPVPGPTDWTGGVTNYGMMTNDVLGSCTIAAVGHAVQIATLNTSSEITVPDSIVLGAYENWCGYNPSDPATDQGGIEVDVLNDWRKFNFGGHLLPLYADPTPGNADHIKQSIALFGGVYIGIGLPLSAQNQSIWDVVPDPGDGSTQPYSWGGHAVFCPAFDATYITCITWGSLQKMTWAFWESYCDEAHAILMQDWLTSKNYSPSKFNYTLAKADLAAVTG